MFILCFSLPYRFLILLFAQAPRESAYLKHHAQTVIYVVLIGITAADNHLKVPHTLQNRILRLMRRKNWYISNNVIHDDPGIPNLRDYFVEMAGTTGRRTATSPHPIVKRLTALDLGRSPRLKTQRADKVLGMFQPN